MLDMGKWGEDRERRGGKGGENRRKNVGGEKGKWGKRRLN
jgi:hypothetical protein